MTTREESPRRGGASLLAPAVALICCLVAPLLAGALGGAALAPSLGLVVAIAAGLVLASGCYAVTRARRRRRGP